MTSLPQTTTTLEFLAAAVGKYDFGGIGGTATLKRRSNPPQADTFDSVQRRFEALLGTAQAAPGQAQPVNGSGEPLAAIQCLRDIFAEVKHLSDLIDIQQFTFIPTLKFLTAPMSSANAQVCLWTSKIVARVVFNVGCGVSPTGAAGQANAIDAYRWFISDDGAVDTVLQCFIVHPKLHASVFSVLEQVARPELGHFVTIFLTERIPDRGQYFMFVHELLESMCLSATSKKSIRDAGLPRTLVDFISNAAADKSSSVDTRLSGYMLATFLFSNFATNEDAYVNTVLSVLKKGCHDWQAAIRVNCFACLSIILEQLLDRNPALATDVYKFQLFVMIEFHTDPSKSYFQRSMINLLEGYPKLPVNVIVEPFLKTLLVHKYDNLDFDVIFALAKHPSLDVLHASRLFAFLWTVAMHDWVFTRAANLCLLIIVNRFHKRLLSDLDRSIEAAIANAVTLVSDGKELTMEQDAKLRMSSDVIVSLVMLKHPELNSIAEEWVKRIPADNLVKHPSLNAIAESLHVD